MLAVLEKTFGKHDIILNTNTNIIALIEFAFFKAEGPYSPDFDKQVTVIKRILEIHLPMIDLLNRSANHAIGNMILNARGRLKFTISDSYELMKVLRTWQYLGLNKKSHQSVFNAIQAKMSIQKRLKRKDPYLIARLEAIFPQWRKEINPSNIDVNQVIFKEQQSRFDTLIQSLREKGVSIDEMIHKENNREIPVGVKRNNFLSYLVKSKHNFTCQLKKYLSCRSIYSKVQSHHILPISKGGYEHFSNLIVLCSYHHELVHQGRLEITLLGKPAKISIKYKQKWYEIAPN